MLFLVGKTSSILRMQVEGAKVTSTIWGPLDKTIITGHDDGTITQWDTTVRCSLLILRNFFCEFDLFCYFLQTGRIMNTIKEHKNAINDIQKNSDGTMFITASKDCTAKLFDVEDLSLLKTYTTERPVNSAAVSPIFDHVRTLVL